MSILNDLGNNNVNKQILSVTVEKRPSMQLEILYSVQYLY